MSITRRSPVAALPEPAERIRLRKIFDVSQAELAQECAVTRKTVYAWEHGLSEPTGRKRARYAEILRVWAQRASQLATGGNHATHCRCGYPADNSQDLAEHIETSARINDGRSHG